MAKKKAASDFRYDTGEAVIPWAAVGENVQQKEIMSMLEFLVRPAPGKKTKYDAELKKLAKNLDNLSAVGLPAGKLSLAGNVQALEEQACKLLKAKHACFVTSCTSGFEIAFQFAGLKPGDEVIAPSNTFIATVAYPLSIGAKVVLADSDPATLNMDVNDVAKKITKKTKAVIPVHLGGYPVDMDPLMKLARKHDFTVIEDAAHGFGGSYKGKMMGAIGHFGAFSFHEVKNITALGEGGILVSSTPWGKEMRRARFLGIDMSRQVPKWLYDVPAMKGKGGYFQSGNFSSTELQALCLMSQMKRLKSIIAKRKKAATYLNRRFNKVPGITTPPGDNKNVKSTYHLYLFQIDPEIIGDDIQTLKKKLDVRGVVQIPHYAPLYKFSVFKQLGYDAKAMEESCPVTEEAFQHRFTHLPLYDFSDEQMKLYADLVIDAVNELKAGR